jgi:hypothetical protein
MLLRRQCQWWITHASRAVRLHPALNKQALLIDHSASPARHVAAWSLLAHVVEAAAATANEYARGTWMLSGDSARRAGVVLRRHTQPRCKETGYIAMYEYTDVGFRYSFAKKLFMT